MRYTIRHAVETDVDTFWRLSFDDEFTRALMQSLAGSLQLKAESHTDCHGNVHRRVEYTPRVAVPRLIEKFLGNGAYTEIGQFEPAAKRYIARCLPKVGADRLAINLEICTEPLAGKRCERILVMENVVNIFGFGKSIEKLIERSQRVAQDRIVEFTNTWIRERGL